MATRTTRGNASRKAIAAVIAAALSVTLHAGAAQAQDAQPAPAAPTAPTTERITPPSPDSTGSATTGSATDPTGSPSTAPATGAAPAGTAPASGAVVTLTDADRKILRDDLEKMAIEAAQKGTKPFEFHGYLRSGFGLNEKGGHQDAFGLPGAGNRGGGPQKYRLGNETESYGEAIFVNNWLNPKPEDGVTFKTEVLLAMLTNELNDFDTTSKFIVREAFAEAGGLIHAAPELKIWAGQRFYRRQDIFINDFFFYDMSGYGGGLLDAPIGFGKLSVAYLGGSTDQNLTSGKAAYVSQTPAKSMLDIRFTDMPMLGGKGEVWLVGAHQTGGTLAADNSRLDNIQGYALGFIHKVENILGSGFERFSVQFGTGPMLDFNTFYSPSSTYLPAGADPGTYAVQHAKRIRFTESVQLQPSDMFSFMAMATYQYSDFGSNTPGVDAKESWYSIGGRPTLHFGQYFGIASDVGFDYVDSKFSKSGWMFKGAIAPQVTAGNTFWSRPSIRTYLSAATWDPYLKGLIGGPAHANDSFGLGFGVQMESWW